MRREVKCGNVGGRRERVAKVGIRLEVRSRWVIVGKRSGVAGFERVIVFERRVREWRGRVARGLRVDRVVRSLADRERVVRWGAESGVGVVLRELEARERACSAGKVEVRVVIWKLGNQRVWVRRLRSLLLPKIGGCRRERGL